eukprot:scpid4330/ scgid10036/ 
MLGVLIPFRDHARCTISIQRSCSVYEPGGLTVLAVVECTGEADAGGSVSVTCWCSTSVDFQGLYSTTGDILRAVALLVVGNAKLVVTRGDGVGCDIMICAAAAVGMQSKLR